MQFDLFLKVISSFVSLIILQCEVHEFSKRVSTGLNMSAANYEFCDKKFLFVSGLFIKLWKLYDHIFLENGDVCALRNWVLNSKGPEDSAVGAFIRSRTYVTQCIVPVVFFYKRHLRKCILFRC